MENKITDIDDTNNQDRSELNVSVSGKKKSPAFLIGLVIIAVMVVGCAFALSVLVFKNKNETVELPAGTENFNAGKQKDDLQDSEVFFSNVKEQLKLKAEREERLRLKALNNKPKPKKEITIVKSDINRQPKPKVTKKTAKSTRQPRRNKELTPAQRRLSGDVTYVSNNVGAPLPEASSFDDSFDGSRFKAGEASLRPTGSLSYLLQHGMNIPCSLYTQIISDYSGFVTCRVTKDVYSANGAILLVEAGSMISGTQKVSLEKGKSRIFTIWSDIETPNGASIIIDSLGAGALGAAGHKVWIDNHFKERFGGAILLSFIDDAFAAVAQNASSEDIDLNNSTDTANDIASQALQSSIDIKPTGYSHLGQRINIIVTRDIDFSSVYTIGALND